MDDQKLGFLIGMWTAVIVGHIGWFAYGSMFNFVTTVISLALVFTLIYGAPPTAKHLLANLREA